MVRFPDCRHSIPDGNLTEHGLVPTEFERERGGFERETAGLVGPETVEVFGVVHGIEGSLDYSPGKDVPVGIARARKKAVCSVGVE